MAIKLEQLSDRGQEIKEGYDDATDTGREIAEMKKRQADALEGVTPPEDSDFEAIAAANEAIRNEARADDKDRTSDAVDELSQESEGLQREGTESEGETRDSSRAVDQASSIGDYGSSSLEGASEQIRESADAFRDRVAELMKQAEQAKRRVREVESEI